MAAPGSNNPVWWDKEVDAAGRPIRLDVRTAAHQIWDSARRQAQHLLGDVSEAPELMENAVAQVSRYLDRTGADLFTQNTAGILMCAICRSLRRYAMKLNRLELVGGSAELSERRIAPNRANPTSAIFSEKFILSYCGRNLGVRVKAYPRCLH